MADNLYPRRVTGNVVVRRQMSDVSRQTLAAGHRWHVELGIYDRTRAVEDSELRPEG